MNSAAANGAGLRWEGSVPAPWTLPADGPALLALPSAYPPSESRALAPWEKRILPLRPGNSPVDALRLPYLARLCRLPPGSAPCGCAWLRPPHHGWSVLSHRLRPPALPDHWRPCPRSRCTRVAHRVQW